MSHISSIGAALFSDLSVSAPATDITPMLSSLGADTEFQSLFNGSAIESVGGVASGTVNNTSGVVAGTSVAFIRIKNARSFPAMGTPANIVKVPTYGQKTSSSIQGQADAPQLEIDLNFIPSEWASTTLLGAMVGSGQQKVFRFTLLAAEPTAADLTKYASTAGGLGTVGNSQYYWYGKMEALLVTPSLTDAVTAKLTLSIQSQFYGAFTI